LVAVAAHGCATIQPGPPTVERRHISTRTQTQKVTGQPKAQVVQDGTTATFRVFQACTLFEREVETVEVVQRSELENRTPAVDQTAAVIGGVLMGVGIYGIADANAIASRSEDSSLSDPDKVRQASALTLGVGAALLSIAVVDVVRASGSEETTSRQEVPGHLTSTGDACPDVPAPGLKISAIIRRRRVPLGTTDDKGLLSLNLLEVLPPTGTDDLKIRTILEGGREIGTLDVVPLAKEWELMSWNRAKDAVCQDSADEGCATLESFVQAFPSGDHAPSARKTLASAIWRRVSVAECMYSSDPGCDDLRRFASTFADCPQAEDAKKRLVDADARAVGQQRALAVAEAQRQARALATQRAEEQRQVKAQASQRAMEVCRQKCSGGCKGEPDCVNQCVAVSCK
jgi:hypothetical protein